LFLLVFYVLLAMLVSFMCSMMEAALLSISNSYIRALENRGKKSGTILRQFKSNIDIPLAAILTLNTIANIVGATGAGAQAQKIFKNHWVTLFTVLFTLSILIFSEIIPKTIGAVYWRSLATPTAYILRIIIFILYPFVIFARWITRFLTPKNPLNLSVFRQEIAMLAEIGEDRGALSPWEESVIKNILRLEKIRVKQIMTPRTVLFGFPRETTIAEVMEKSGGLPFSRIPIYDTTLDNMIGMVLRHDILDAAAKDSEDMPLKEMLRSLHPIPESLSAARAIEQFIKRREQIFLVIDEYGGTAGIVTLEDAMESLLGKEIVDEMDTVEDMQELATRMWRYRLSNFEGEIMREEEIERRKENNEPGEK